jgi:glutathione synthase/RimK-type ligase-like ATP-grasp enzyme
MVLLCGIPSEPPLALVAGALRDLREPFFVLNQRRCGDTHLDFTVAGGRVTGLLECGTETYRLEEFGGVYVRLMDDRALPEVRDEDEASPLRAHCRAVHETLSLWLELTGARVLNRPSSMASNNSKPFQAQLIRRHGFCVPETLVTNDPDEVLRFRERHGRVVFKSISGVRSIVRAFENADLDRLSRIRWCPAQFQPLVEGFDVRVHVVGPAVFATRVRSAAVDYRYARSQVGEAAELEPYDLPDGTAARCVALAGALDLPLAGIDLRVTPSGAVYCFEVNPCPGYSYYEGNTGQPISRAIALYLAGRSLAGVDRPVENAPDLVRPEPG